MGLPLTNFILAIAVIALSLGVQANESGLSGELQAIGGQRTNIRNIDELRDPFRRSTVRSRQRVIQTEPRTTFTRNIPTIDGVPLNLIRVVGILLGEDRRAIAKISSGVSEFGEDNLSADGFVLREGMRIGENNAEIKAILPGGIVLVEKIRNIYDQDEYLETIIPLTLQQ
jgi:Tfp pilus assembly protein PilP